MIFGYIILTLISLILGQFSVYAINNDFSASVEPLSEIYQNNFIKQKYWNEDCPIKLTELSDLKVTYWGLDSKTHQGEIIVHNKIALEVVNIFYELFLVKFPIYEMKPYQLYPLGEYAKHNDTVGYYCSVAQDEKTVYSTHAYGTAIDINPSLNPFLDAKDGWWPKGSDKYSNRNQNIKGMIRVKDEVFNIFTKYGWTWGGLEKDIDYMHFSKGMADNYLVSGLIYLPQDQRIRTELKKVTK